MKPKPGQWFSSKEEPFMKNIFMFLVLKIAPVNNNEQRDFINTQFYTCLQFDPVGRSWLNQWVALEFLEKYCNLVVPCSSIQAKSIQVIGL